MDTISNSLTIIRNGYLAGKTFVTVPYSKFIKNILDILAKEGYVDSLKITEVGKIKQLEVRLKYDGKTPSLTGIIKVSKPGRRIYRTKNRIPKSPSGFGITIISTPEGVMTDGQARRKKLGGEVICQVW